MIFERPPVETLAPAKDRWTPLYLEHGRLEVDDSSVKWIGSDGMITRLPVATVSALILGPGTTITHAAVKACADSNTPLLWMGEEGMRFYAAGLTPTHDNTRARLHARLWASRRDRERIARAMFRFRFSDVEVGGSTIQQLRGAEGKRVKVEYARLGRVHGIEWRGRSYDPKKWDRADPVNRALSAANASLYALCAAVVKTMGLLPELGFVHDAGTLPFIYDVADLYKHETSWPAGFEAAARDPEDDGRLARTLLKQRVESTRMLQRMPRDLETLIAEEGGSLPARPTRETADFAPAAPMPAAADDENLPSEDPPAQP